MIRYFGIGNLANYTNEEAQGILREIYSITDERTLREKYKTLQNIYEEERPYIGLYFNTKRAIYVKDLTADISESWYNIFSNIQNWNKKN